MIDKYTSYIRKNIRGITYFEMKQNLGSPIGMKNVYDLKFIILKISVDDFICEVEHIMEDVKRIALYYNIVIKNIDFRFTLKYRPSTHHQRKVTMNYNDDGSLRLYSYHSAISNGVITRIRIKGARQRVR